MCAKNKLKKYYKNMKEKLNELMKRFQAKPKHTQDNDISKWVQMKYYQPFKINEKKLVMI